MPTIVPITSALVPRDSAAAARLHAPNYDEFQGDDEIRALIQARPDCLLRVTMAHCDVPPGAPLDHDGSAEALARAARNFAALRSGPLVRPLRDVLFVVGIDDPRRPGVHQVGLGGLALTREIRGDATPRGVLVRNEGIREEKARGRAELIAHTQALTDCVNMAVEDVSGAFAAALAAITGARGADFHVIDEKGSTHRVWLVTEPAARAALTAALATEPCAYVADGNHRSAAAAMAGLDGFLAVFFPAATMGIRPYNRLVHAPPLPPATLDAALRASFDVDVLDVAAWQPERTHEIGLYTAGTWRRLRPRPGSFDATDAAADIDADIVQRRLFADVFAITDARDARLTFVGGDRSADYLRAQVDAGASTYAVTLPPVTMAQFIAVCRQGRFMPPKSTWFEPKLRSGLVTALLAGN
jgi:uncharacterized protein (DUF1015 family)